MHATVYWNTYGHTTCRISVNVYIHVYIPFCDLICLFSSMAICILYTLPDTLVDSLSGLKWIPYEIPLYTLLDTILDSLSCNVPLLHSLSCTISLKDSLSYTPLNEGWSEVDTL